MVDGRSIIAGAVLTPARPTDSQPNYREHKNEDMRDDFGFRIRSRKTRDQASNGQKTADADSNPSGVSGHSYSFTSADNFTPIAPANFRSIDIRGSLVFWMNCQADLRAVAERSGVAFG